MQGLIARRDIKQLGINRRLTYTVRDLALELHLFPDFDGRDLRFATAGPGEKGHDTWEPRESYKTGGASTWITSCKAGSVASPASNTPN